MPIEAQIAEDKYLVSVHFHEHTERNPFSLILIAMKGSEYGTWHRIMQARGINMNPVAQREMTATEIERYDKVWRLVSVRYKSFEGLINDEYACTENNEWCKRLYEVSGIKEPYEKIIER